jgi:hypothetical protein
MELVEATLTPLQRRSGAAWVPWRDLAAQQRRRGEPIRVLAPGDDVMLQVDDTVVRGWVLRNAAANGDGAYVIMFGAALGRRVPLSTQRRPEPVVQDVEVRVVPAQRDRRVSLYL